MRSLRPGARDALSSARSPRRPTRPPCLSSLLGTDALSQVIFSMSTAKREKREQRQLCVRATKTGAKDQNGQAGKLTSRSSSGTEDRATVQMTRRKRKTRMSYETKRKTFNREEPNQGARTSRRQQGGARRQLGEARPVRSRLACVPTGPAFDALVERKKGVSREVKWTRREGEGRRTVRTGRVREALRE